MRRFRRFLPFLGALLLFGTFEFVIQFTESLLLEFGFVLGIIFLVSAFLTNFERLPRGWWHTLFAPMLLGLATITLILFVEEAFTRHLLAVLASLLILFLWENLWRFYWAPERYHNEALENTSLALNTTTIWFTSATLYYVLLDPSVLPYQIAGNVLALATLVVLIMVFILDYGTVWVQRYPPGKVWLWLIATATVVSEVFWVVNFLPHRVEVKTYLVVLTYYLLTHLGRSHLDGTLKPLTARRYAYVAIGSLLAVLVTAHWLV